MLSLLTDLALTFSPASRRLAAVYGDETVNLQCTRYREALERFAVLYPDASEVVVARAPGRVTVAGQHNDYNHAQILNFPIRQDTLVLAAPRRDDRIVLANMEVRYAPKEFTIDHLEVQARPRRELEWWDYLQAMTAQMLQIADRRKARLSGMNVLVDSRLECGGLPAGAGLGSSSALLNAFGLACAFSAYPRFQPTVSQLATAAMSSENALGFPSGLQDPMGSIGGELGGSERRPRVILIDSLPRERSGEPYVGMRTIPLTSIIRLLLVHTGVPKEPSAWKEFNVRADEAKLSSWLMAHWLAERYPRFFSDPKRVMNAYPDVTKPESTVYPPFWRPFYFTGAELHRAGLSVSSSELAELAARLPKNTDRAQIVTMGMPHVVFDELTSGSRIAGEAMDARFLNLKGSFCHVVTEQERVLRAIAAVERGDLLELGNLQKEIFESLDLNYRVVSSAAKALVADVGKMPGVLTVRPLGGVWGCIAAVWLCEDVATDALMENIRTSFYDPRGLTRSEVLMMPTTPGTGAQVIFPMII